MPSYSYSDGTITIVGGSAVVAGTGTAFSTVAKAGDVVAAKVAMPNLGAINTKPIKMSG